MINNNNIDKEIVLEKFTCELTYYRVGKSKNEDSNLELIIDNSGKGRQYKIS